jgi:hypothetical protein
MSCATPWITASSPEARQAAGKPESRHPPVGSDRGDQVVIEVIDDGAGMDPAGSAISLSLGA